MNTYFLASFAVLSLLLFFPTSKLIWSSSVRRLQKKTKSELSAEELGGQLKRARFIALLIVPIFSFLFCISIGLRP